MIRKLTTEVAEFSPATTVSVCFSEDETYDFNDVILAQKTEDGTILIQMEDGSFAEISKSYLYYQIGEE